MIVQLIVIFCVSNFAVQGETAENLRTSSGEERIVGGAPALRNEYPFIVSIQEFAPGANKGDNFCGGSIIDRQWVLTAAHCFSEHPNDVDIYINAGTNNAYSYSGKNQLVAVDKYFNHEQYNPSTHEHDICLLKLMYPLNFTDAVHAIKLPAADYKPEIKGYGVIMGYGAVDAKDHTINLGQLKKTFQDIMSADKCKEYWDELFDTQLCLHDKYHPSADCSGDSGGPFIQYIKGEAYAIGITSYGNAVCGLEPSVYTRVANYLEWINSTITFNTYRKELHLVPRDR